MPIVHTKDLVPGQVRHDNAQVYNGLDCCVTFEVMEELSSLFNQDPLIYDFERALQAPALAMMLRGFAIDEYERQQGIALLKVKLEVLTKVLNAYAFAVWDKPLNPRSPKQLLEFFYGTMRLPEQWTSQKGVKRLSTNRESLEKLEVYFYARPIVAAILAIRENAGRLNVLETEVEPDGRMRTSYNIAGTETGRWSSSASAWMTGTNLQNITPELRRMFVADQGKKLCVIDLEQAESREVGWLCGILFDEWSYLDACESGDLHTTTAKLIWPKLGWPEDPKLAKALAESPFYRHFTYRDMSKRGGHGCLPKGHEVLTPNGWVDISTKPPVIMTWSTERSCFAPVSHWTDQPYEGEFIHASGTSLSIEMTGDHKVIFYKDKRNLPHEAPANQFPKTGFIPLGFGYVGGTAHISPATARLIAAFQCDGYQKAPGLIEFHFHKDRKFMRLEMLAVEAEIGFRKRGDKADIFADGWPKKAGAYLLNWPRAALLAYIEEHKHWDGHISDTAVSLFSVDKNHLEWLQTIGRLLGIGGNFQVPTTSGFGSIVQRLQQNNRQYASINSLERVVSFHGRAQVYCPTVPSGAFYIRKDGRISVTGNSNYYGTPFTMSRHLKVPTKFMVDFQDSYFEAFPGIPMWHRWVAEQIQTNQHLTTPFGRQRHFFGRPGDDTTLREAIAFSPQSSTGDRMNLGIWKIWKYLPEAELIGQVHDAVIFQYDPALEQEIVPKALSLISVPLTHNGRTYDVPGEAKIGWNWGYVPNPNVKPGQKPPRPNPDGLLKFNPTKPDTRIRSTILTRRL